MSVPAAPDRPLAVVQMERHQSLEEPLAAQRVRQAVPRLGPRQVEPRRVQMAGVDEDAQAVASSDGEEPEGGHDRQGDLALLALRRAEVQARRAIHHQAGLELPVGFCGAHVGREGPGRKAPVDAAGVVARAVGASAGRLRPRPRCEGEVVAAQHAVEATGDVELQAAQQRRLGRDRGRVGGRGRRRRGRWDALPAPAEARGASGTAHPAASSPDARYSAAGTAYAPASGSPRFAPLACERAHNIVQVRALFEPDSENRAENTDWGMGPEHGGRKA